MLFSLAVDVSLTTVFGSIFVVVTSLVLKRVIYNLYLHPLAKFPGPWYAASTSLIPALISLWRVEPQWLLGLTKKYGTDRPIRIAPTLLMFPKPADLKDIYWDPDSNRKAEMYGSGALGPPSIFTTLDGERHRRLRKALGGSQWTIGSLKNTWEPRLDELIMLFMEKMTQSAKARQEVVLSDKMPEFAADVLTMLAFTEPWGFVRNGRDERAYLKSFRESLKFFGLAVRWKSYRDYVLKSPTLSPYLLPSISDTHGMGYLAHHADRQVKEREERMREANGDWKMDNPDLLQHCLDARFSDGSPLSPEEKRAHITLLIQAGADTTGTGLGCTLRYILTHPTALKRARAEIDVADKAGKLSRPICYEESRKHLPFVGACIKESLRLGPPGTDMATYTYVVQRDPTLYAPDPEAFRPDRWLEPGRGSEMEAASFAFGMGPRVCLGKDVAYMEMWKLIPEIIRYFDFQLLDAGKYVVAGGVAFNENLRVLLSRRAD